MPLVSIMNISFKVPRPVIEVFAVFFEAWSSFIVNKGFEQQHNCTVLFDELISVTRERAVSRAPWVFISVSFISARDFELAYHLVSQPLGTDDASATVPVRSTGRIASRRNARSRRFRSDKVWKKLPCFFTGFPIEILLSVHKNLRYSGWIIKNSLE